MPYRLLIINIAILKRCSSLILVLIVLRVVILRVLRL